VGCTQRVDVVRPEAGVVVVVLGKGSSVEEVFWGTDGWWKFWWS
jgi:hypothetical protein